MITPAGSDTLSLIEALPPGAVLTLDGVTWDEYEKLLQQLDDRAGVRLAYDKGTLEIMSPSQKHEGIAGLFPLLLVTLAEECRLNFRSFGSMTMRKPKALKGLEPGDCFYFRNVVRTSERKHFDASVDPPPDLAIEIEVASGSMNKFPIFAAIGIPELWRHARDKVYIYRLTGKTYGEVSQSDLFPFLTPADISRFLRKGEAEGGVPMLKAFRKWVRAHKPRSRR